MASKKLFETKISIANSAPKTELIQIKISRTKHKTNSKLNVH